MKEGACGGKLPGAQAIAGPATRADVNMLMLICRPGKAQPPPGKGNSVACFINHKLLAAVARVRLRQQRALCQRGINGLSFDGNLHFG